LSQPNSNNKVVVVGSLSMDLVLTVPRLPKVGETLQGQTFNTFVGGKGNNQALAAARLGARVAMLGQVGNDEYGKIVLDNLKQNNVDTTHMLIDKNIGTGIANIWVGPDGSNSIIIIANSNGTLSPKHVEQCQTMLDNSKVLLLQLEIPMETVIAAARAGKARGLTVVLNPAPAPADGQLSSELLQLVDVFVPNETEAQLLTGILPQDQASAINCAQALIAMGPKAVILTLGERGAMVLQKDGKAEFISSHKVKVVDSTAAGDAFVGALGAKLAEGVSLAEAVRYGCAAGALACTVSGAAPSLPTAAALESLLVTSR